MYLFYLYSTCFGTIRRRAAYRKRRNRRGLYNRDEEKRSFEGRKSFMNYCFTRFLPSAPPPEENPPYASKLYGRFQILSQHVFNSYIQPDLYKYVWWPCIDIWHTGIFNYSAHNYDSILYLKAGDIIEGFHKTREYVFLSTWSWYYHSSSIR